MIRLSEFLPAPRDVFSQEWVELENLSNEEVQLNGWQIDDAEGGSSPITLSAEHTIGPHGYLLVELNKAILNNSGDTLRLLAPDGTVVDEVTINASRPDRSYSLIDGRWDDTAEPSPGQPNQAIGDIADQSTVSLSIEGQNDTAIQAASQAAGGAVVAPVTEMAPLPTSRAAENEALYEAQLGEIYLFAPTVTPAPLPVTTAPALAAAPPQPESSMESWWLSALGGLLLLIAAVLFFTGRNVSGEDISDDTGA
jgi:hypothetical protein